MNVEAPVTPACSQCRVRKVRCRREQPTCSNCLKSGLACDYSNQTKRVNHTKQLAEDFSSVSNRLERIESTLQRITQQLDQSQHPHSGPDLAEHRGTASSRKRHGGRLHRILCRNTSQEKFSHGPTSNEALFESAIEMLDRLLTTQSITGGQSISNQVSPMFRAVPQEEAAFIDPTTNETASTTTQQQRLSSLIQESLPLPFCCDRSSVTSDGRYVSVPPQSFVRVAVRFYLEESHHLLPIFDADKLSRIAETHYTDAPGSTYNSWTLCLNNIVVLAMRSRLSKTTDTSDPTSGTMDPGLYARFLANSSRAFSQLDAYTGQNLVDVQALLTLAMIALEHFSVVEFHRIIRRACFKGQELQLQYQSDAVSEDPGLRERQSVFWALYILDKERCFAGGTSCDIYHSDCQVALPASNNIAEMTDHAIRIARIQMMLLWEKLWSALFSPQAQQCSEVERASRVAQLSQLFSRWANQYYPQSMHGSTTNILDALNCSRLQLWYCYHTGRLFLENSIENSSAQNRLHDARLALRILISIHEAEESTLKLPLLARLCRSYSMIAFFQLHKHLLTTWNSDSQKDIQLLRSTMNVVELLTINSCTGQTHLDILLGQMQWCLTMNKVVNSLHNRPFDQQLFEMLPNVSDRVWNTLRGQIMPQSASNLEAPSYMQFDSSHPYEIPVGFSSESSSTMLSPTSQPLISDIGSDLAFAGHCDTGYTDYADNNLHSITAQFDAANTITDFSQDPESAQQYHVDTIYAHPGQTMQALGGSEMATLSASTANTMAPSGPDDLASTAAVDQLTSVEFSEDQMAESSQNAQSRASRRRGYSKSARLF